MKQNSRSIVCEEIPTVFLATQTLMCLRMSWDFWPFLFLRQFKWDFTSDLTVFAYFDFLSFSNLIYLKYFLFKWKIGRRRRNLGRNLKQVVMGCSFLINSSISCELNLRNFSISSLATNQTVFDVCISNSLKFFQNERSETTANWRQNLCWLENFLVQSPRTVAAYLYSFLAPFLLVGIFF